MIPPSVERLAGTPAWKTIVESAGCTATKCEYQPCTPKMLFVVLLLSSVQVSPKLSVLQSDPTPVVLSATLA